MSWNCKWLLWLIVHGIFIVIHCNVHINSSRSFNEKLSELIIIVFFAITAEPVRVLFEWATYIYQRADACAVRHLFEQHSNYYSLTLLLTIRRVVHRKLKNTVNKNLYIQYILFIRNRTLPRQHSHRHQFVRVPCICSQSDCSGVSNEYMLPTTAVLCWLPPPLFILYFWNLCFELVFRSISLVCCSISYV